MTDQDSSAALKARIAELEQALQALQHAGQNQTPTDTTDVPASQARAFEAEIKARELQFHYAMEASQDGLWDWNITTGKIYFSRSYLRLLGYDYDPLPGSMETLRHYFLYPEDIESLQIEFEAAITNRRERINLEHRMLHRNGHTLWVHAQGIFVEPDADGKPTRCVGTISDISAMVRSKEELIAAKAEADIASNAKSKFLASMSHEIRTPMNAIIGLGHLLNETPLDEAQQSYLTSMNAAANSLLQVINQVFDYTKLEAGNIILENSHFDLEQMFERLSRIFESNALHKPVSIIFDIADNVPRFLRGDATRLSHVISHLVTNALLYSEGDQVLVKATCASTANQLITLRFSISDYGEGLPAEQVEKIRTELTRAPYGPNQKKTQGFGLQICKLLVQLMNGTLHIVSKRGEGTTLSFTADFEKSHIGANRLREDFNICRSMRLLIVDDNKLAREILSKSAAKLITHIDTAADAHTALKKIRDAQQANTPYDLLLLDYKMPLKSGIEAACEIKTAPDIERKPIIFLVSSFHRDEIFSDHHNSQYVDDFLSKPVSESRLFDAICRAFPECLSIPENTAVTNHPDLSGTRVLLVEDNPVNQTVAQGIMQKRGVTVVCANNGAEAIEELLATDEPFDVILMDVEMPVMDGLEATRKIRENDELKHLPIVAVTAQAMAGDRQTCIDAGMNDYISKPINPRELYQLLSDLIQTTRTALPTKPK